MNEEVVVKMGMDTTPFAAGLRSMRAMSQEAGHKIKESFSELGKELLAPLSGGFALVAFEKVLDYAERLKDTSETLGISTRFLQAWSNAAVEEGVSAEKAERAIGKLAEKVGQARDGSEDAIKAFKGMAISLYDASDRGKKLETIMGDVADRIKNTQDGAERARIAFEAFGKAGVEMLPMLMHGSEGLAEMSKQMSGLSQLTEKEIADLARINQELHVSEKKATIFAGKFFEWNFQDYRILKGAIDGLWDGAAKGYKDANERRKSGAKDGSENRDIGLVNGAAKGLYQGYMDVVKKEYGIIAEQAKKAAEVAGIIHDYTKELGEIEKMDRGEAIRRMTIEEKIEAIRKATSSALNRAYDSGSDEQTKLQAYIEYRQLLEKGEEEKLKRKEEIEKQIRDSGQEQLRRTEEQLKLEGKLTQARIDYNNAQKAIKDHDKLASQYSLEELRNSRFSFGGKLGNDQRLAFQIKEWENRLAWDKEHGFGDTIQDIDLPKIKELRRQLSSNNVLASERSPDEALEMAVAKAAGDWSASMNEVLTKTIVKVIPFSGP